VDFPAPPTVNDLERMHHRATTALRQACEARWGAGRPRGWQPLERFRVEVVITTTRKAWLCDPMELGYRVKRHMDAAKRARVIVDDGPNHLVPTLPLQVVGDEPGMTIRLVELL
jgi:hypothetical protein